MDVMTPGEVADHLQVSAPTVRRMAGAYELVFGPLERDSRRHRAWSLDAVRRVQVAHAALSTGKITSLEAALQMVRDGLDLPVPTVLPVQHDVLAELLAEVRGLRVLAEAQGRELTALRSAMTENRVLPVPGFADDELAELKVLRTAVALASTMPPPIPNEIVAELASAKNAVAVLMAKKRARDRHPLAVLLRLIGVRL